ncbi:endonuclease/exonuclease/phosphatase family protein [Parabacteroides sp. AM08-6]|uniref:endonuclease/exonuclease/phosphatase family protein n=1 Tax=Parabacteroides sp. AM08-6 TaxID=2292053 RepID=UPI000F000D14|nr:endonuclease/exonuclease/phosphatase family protein [Parabacteroides sp. AM08-6]RHJ86494.1 endonuclease [Parabacteroides sp. AM08-6]
MSERFKAVKVLFKSVFVTANVALALLLIASAFSDRVSPEKSVLLSYLGLGFPVLCILNLCFVIYWLFLWEWRCILIGLVTFLICKGPVGNYFPFHNRVDDIPKEKTIKVLTYNVMGFGYRDHTKELPNPIVKYIANSGADIVCLQEYAIGKSKKFLTAQKLLDAFSMYRYNSIVQTGSSGTLTYHIAVFSKYPLSKSRKINYESTFNGSSIHEVDINGKKLTLINNHLESFKLTTEDRSRYSAFIKNINSETFDGLKGAIQQKLGPAFRIRARQAETVAAEVKNIKTDYILVCGDFNDTPISYAHRTIQGPLTDAYAASGRGAGITYNENFFWFRIDNILHSPNMKALNCTVDKVRYSDHYPMWCYLQMEE